MQQGNFIDVFLAFVLSRCFMCASSRCCRNTLAIDEAINTTKTQLAKNDSRTTHQITSLLEVILKQNYFKFQDQIYQPDKGVAMGPLISGTIAKFHIIS